LTYVPVIADAHSTEECLEPYKLTEQLMTEVRIVA